MVLQPRYSFLRKADGVVSVSSMAYESASVEAFRRWLLEFGRDIYAIGPLLPPNTTLNTGAKDAEKEMSHNGSETEDFLNHIFKKYGQHSLLYVCFQCPLPNMTNKLDTDFIWQRLLASYRLSYESYRCSFRT